MKMFPCFSGRAGLLGGLALFTFATLLRADLPVIESIRIEHTNLVVTAQVPAGCARVTLESRAGLGGGAWVPVAVERLDGQGGRLTFRVPREGDFAVLRIRADETEPLPSFFFSGPSEFAAQPATGRGEGPLLFDGGGAPGTGPATSREVVESDIWRFEGDTLYFFNQQRGLQVIDVSQPDAAVLRGTLNLPAAGEQMYLLRSKHAVLLTRNDCGGYGGAGDSEVLIVAVNDGVPSVAARLAVAGTITESRLVGSALYVATQSLRPKPGSGGSIWEWGTLITSFDLANPESPVTRSTLWYAGYNNVVHATDTYLFAVTQSASNFQQSLVNIVDTTAPDGTMHAHDTITAAGRVQDKFKLDWTDGIFSVISEVSSNPRLTKLETFRLPDPRTVPPFSHLKLGEVEVGHGERLFATRFAYPRAYLVTFLQIDPLWIVDLSNPARPTVSGELEVPGWSTYIHPRGDQLVAVGVETNRTTVSLFDVSVPSHPALLSRVSLGHHYSSSEANQDEKAFNVLEDAGLILLPVQGDTTNGWRSWVQLIDLGMNELTARGIIEHDFNPRRATLHRDRVLSLSARELLSVDAADRDHPALTGRLELAWPVNRVLLAGDYLIEITAGGFGEVYYPGFVRGVPTATSVVRVALADHPDAVLAMVTLTNAPIAGASLRGNRLYVAQAAVEGWVTAGGETNSPPPPNLWLTILDLSQLPAISILGQTAITTAPLGWYTEFEPVWPKPDLLVWVGGGDRYWWWGPWIGLGGLDFVGGWFWGYPQSSGGGRLFAFEVSDAASPAFRSEVDLTAGGGWNFSKPQVAGSLVYLSHESFVEITVTNSEGKLIESPTGVVVDWPTGYQRSFLDVVDYADPRQPTVRKPVSLAGTLRGLSHEGALLYTVGFQRSPAEDYQGANALVASAYDGVAVHRVDALSLSNTYSHPVLVSGTNLFLGRAQTSNNGTIPAALETWTLSHAGKFNRLGSVPLPASASDLVAFHGLLAAQVDGVRVMVFDDSDAAALRKVGEGPQAGCFYFNLRHADAAPARGLWLALDAFGVTRINLAQ